MKKCKIISIIAIFLLMISVTVYAQPEATKSKASMLIEFETGEVLYEQNADAKLPVASVTKIMTLCLIFDKIESEQLNPEEIVTVSDNAAGMGGSQVYLESNGKYKVKELIKSIIIASANDACVAMAEHMAGSQQAFVELMNQKAKQLGMHNTCFVNCTGMPSKGHYSTARDVAKMSAELVKHEMFFDYSNIWMDEIQHSGGRITQLTNTNKLVRFFDGCDGIKTGYTDEAGHCISATVCRDNMRLISVIIGGETSQSRFDDARNLINYGFANYEKRELTDHADIPDTIELVGGIEKRISIAPSEQKCVILNKSDRNNVSYTVNLPQSISAPVKRGDVVGSIVFELNGQKIDEINIVAIQDGNKATIWQYFNKLIQQW